MTLFHAILAVGIVLILLGASLLSGSSLVQQKCKAFPRCPIAGYILFGTGSAWFLWNVYNLTKADEIGFLSNEMLLLVFVAIAILTIPFVPDFLSVRGLSILVLLASRAILDLGWMQYSTPQRMLNAVVYVFVVIALITGASPYKLRDFFEWLFAKRSRPIAIGGVALLYGVALTVSAFKL